MCYEITQSSVRIRKKITKYSQSVTRLQHTLGQGQVGDQNVNGLMSSKCRIIMVKCLQNTFLKHVQKQTKISKKNIIVCLILVRFPDRVPRSGVCCVAG